MRSYSKRRLSKHKAGSYCPPKLSGKFASYRVKRAANDLVHIVIAIFSQAPSEHHVPLLLSEGTVTLVIGTETPTEFEVDVADVDASKGLIGVLEYLKSEGKLDFGITGTYLDYVGEIKNDAATGTYIYIYTSVAADADVSEYATTVEYGGKTLTSAGVGAYEMTLSDGAVIYIGTIVW